MPAYLYQCPSCDSVREVNIPYDRHGITIVNCAECMEEVDKEVRMKQILSGEFAVVFKGRGFYSTDNHVEKIPRKVKDEYN